MAKVIFPFIENKVLYKQVLQSILLSPNIDHIFMGTHTRTCVPEQLITVTVPTRCCEFNNTVHRIMFCVNGPVEKFPTLLNIHVMHTPVFDSKVYVGQ